SATPWAGITAVAAISRAHSQSCHQGSETEIPRVRSRFRLVARESAGNARRVLHCLHLYPQHSTRPIRAVSVRGTPRVDVLCVDDVDGDWNDRGRRWVAEEREIPEDRHADRDGLVQPVAVSVDIRRPAARDADRIPRRAGRADARLSIGAAPARTVHLWSGPD